MVDEKILTNLLIILAAGFVSGAICKKLNISLLVGYLVVGAVIGHGVLDWVSQSESHELELLARGGALLLLFSVGIEFSLEELKKLSRFFFVGGSVQMLLVAVPLFFVCQAWGMPWKAALLAGTAGALSSTILVFKALAEWGQTATPHGRRGIAILLFQDVALVPLMLLVPLLTSDESPSIAVYATLAVKSLIFVVAVVLLQRGIARWVVPLLADFRSVELAVLFTLGVLGGVCWAAYMLGLPPSVGALAAGMMLSGNRLSRQIDTLILPFRESFAAVFFITLGTLLVPAQFFAEPFLLSAGLVGMLVLKSLAATLALRLSGLAWRPAAGMGIGLAQLGEFSFLLASEGLAQKLIDQDDFERMLFVALGTLVLTPMLLKLGLRWTEDTPAREETSLTGVPSEPMKRAVVIGVGPIGRQLASRLELSGVDVCLIDLSPINLHAFAQQGFQTVAGDASEPAVLHRAGVADCRLAIVSVAHDKTAQEIARALREQSSELVILVRCRYISNVAAAKKAGATAVISEESEAGTALVQLCDEVLSRAES